jgi:predicted HTH transcriptional regulator
MTVAPWADAKISQMIPTWLASGEGQTIEFKSTFPEQAHTLSENVASFASRGDGVILLGVEKNGTAVGLEGPTEDKRDAHRRRAQSIAQTVKPFPKIECAIGEHNGLVIVVMVIGKQPEPVYYYSGRPYIRDGSVSRIAEPEEVKQFIWAHGSSEHKRNMENLLHQQLKDSHDHSVAMDKAFLDEQRNWSLRLYGR